MAEDTQRLKKNAASAYDYDNDPRWADYWSNILIPPNMASRSDVIKHFKQKFYQRYLDPDLEVEPMCSTGSSQSTRSSTSTTSMPANEPARHRTSGPSSGSSSGASSQTNAPTGSLRVDRQSVQFSINVWVLVVALLAILPVLSRNLSNKAYRVSFLGTAVACAYSLYTQYGKPRAWNLQAIQIWFQSMISCKDFIYLLYSLIFVSSQTHVKFAMIPLICRSLEHVAKFLRRNFSRATFYRRYLDDVCLWVETNTTTLNILSSNAEIGLGFLLIFALFSLLGT
ncbi:hypothetical protein AMTR_s00058p00162790 [Amborella trichopoda]|uniref:Uncharacterized protein n=1 Tax=Amborella trichopoda TaxID=13333 RepID=W1P9N3_AMBTC|nr:hypothetical protein AMTR_s00058p00162790 [Amborella trichopoda]